MIIELPVEFGQRVYIDDDKSIIARVTGFLFRDNYRTAECSWFHNGKAESAWIELWRISIVKEAS